VTPPEEESTVNRSPEAGGGSRWRAAALIALGLALLGALLWSTDLSHVADDVRTLGWWAPFILVPYLVMGVVDAAAWRCTLPSRVRDVVPFAGLYLTRIAGEAINSVTPTATVGGEPVKAHLLRSWGVPGVDGLVSVVLARTALVVAQSLFVALGVAALFVRLEQPGWAATWLAVMLVLTLGFATLLVWFQLRNPALTAWRALRRVFPRSRLLERAEAPATLVDHGLDQFYRFEGHSFAWATSLHLVGWLVGVWEVHLMMSLIGAPVSWLDAFVIEALAQPIRAVALVIPGGLGAQEWGGVMLCTRLGIPEADAVTLWLLKRGRETIFDVVGLAYLGLRSTRSLQRGEEPA
jgi:putative membrane protein